MGNLEHVFILEMLAPNAKMLIPSERDAIVKCFRKNSVLIKRKELILSCVGDLFEYLKADQTLLGEIFWLGYNIDCDPCLLIERDDAVSVLENCNTILSLDGFVFLNKKMTIGMIIDYEEILGSQSTGEIYLSILGEV